MPRTDVRVTAGGEAAAAGTAARQVPYTPGVPTNWRPTPGHVREGLDQLADRVASEVCFFADAIEGNTP